MLQQRIEMMNVNEGGEGKKHHVGDAFRGNNFRPDWAAEKAGAHNVAANHLGSHKVIGAIGAVLVRKLGLSHHYDPGVRMEQLINASLESGRSPVASAVFESI